MTEIASLSAEHAGLLIVTGLIAGFINVVAGGGSLLTLPVLIFMGLPAPLANATNRPAILAQNIAGVIGFRSKGVSAWPFDLYLGLSAFTGAIVGALVSLELDERLFNRVIALIMVVVVGIILTGGNKKNKALQAERMSLKHRALSIVLFFFVGIYGGFIQAGTGFLILAVLNGVNRFSLVKSNSAKTMVALIYTISSLAVFILQDAIIWTYALTLAIGNATGGWIASRWSVNKGDTWIKRILVVMVIVLAIKLWFFQ